MIFYSDVLNEYIHGDYIVKKIKKIAKEFLNSRFSLGYDKHGFEYTVRELVQMYESSREALDWHGEVLGENIKEYKKSDTIFILGSGPSINDITDKQWEDIKSHDSIGFNYWLVHDHVPDMFMFQLSGQNMLDAIKNEHHRYSDKPFIIRGSEFSKSGSDALKNECEFLENNPVFYLREYPVSSKCSIDPDLLIRYMSAMGYMNYGQVSSFIPKWRGTLGLLISLAYQMGYKRIVLCGVDMDGSDHFWDYEPYSLREKKYSLPKMGASNILTFNDVDRSPNTVSLYVEKLRDWMWEKEGVEITVYSKKTVLYPQIEVYKE